MSDLDDQLKGMLDQYDTAQKGRNQNLKAEVNAEDAWVAEFDKVRSTIIRPTMEKLGDKIRLRDHDINIVEQQFRRDNRAIPVEASIRMDLYLATERTRTGIGLDKRPYLMFTTHHRSQMVHVSFCDMTSTGGGTHREGEYPLQSISAFFVQEKFIALFNRLVKK
jgi:hypothetical protein